MTSINLHEPRPRGKPFSCQIVLKVTMMLLRSLTRAATAPVLVLAGVFLGCGASQDPAAAPAVEVTPPAAAPTSEPSAAPAASSASSAAPGAGKSGAPAPATAATSIAS